MDEEKSNTQKYTELVLTYRRVFNTDDGKKVLHDLMSTTHQLSTVVHYDRSGQFNPYMAFFHEGERAVLLKILNILEKTPDDIKAMYSEINKEKNNYDYFR